MFKQVLNNKEVSAILQEVTFLLEVKGEKPFQGNGGGIERKGWLESGHILDAMDDNEMKALLNRRKTS